MDKLNIGQIFYRAGQLYLKNIQVLLPLGFFLAVMSSLGQALVLKFTHDQAQIISWGLLVGTFLTSGPQMMLFQLNQRLIKSKTMDVIESQLNFRKTWSLYLSVVFVMQAIILLGVMLFVVPGIYFSVILWFAPVVAALREEESATIKGCFQRSLFLVKGFFIKVAGILLILMLITAGPVVLLKQNMQSFNLVLSIWLAFVCPFIYLFQSLVYIILAEYKKDNWAEQQLT